MARIAQEVRRAYAACAAALVSGGVDLDAIDALGLNVEMPVFTVSQAAQIAGVHPQTLRQYDRLGLVVPQRTEGGARRYTLRDVARLAQAQQLSQDEGINLAGVTHILSLQEENRQLRRQIRHLRRRLDGDSVFEAGMDGEVAVLSCASARARIYRTVADHIRSRIGGHHPVIVPSGIRWMGLLSYGDVLYPAIVPFYSCRMGLWAGAGWEVGG